MKINQLFRERVPEELLERVAKCFGLQSIHDTTLFCKTDLERHESCNKVIYMLDEIRHYYLPCKARMYLTEMDEGKCITSFRQMLRLHNLNLRSIQKYVNYKKVTYYFISEEATPHKKIKMTQENITISFS
jgi:hypothetical protein